MGKSFMDECYLVNPKLKEGVFRSPNYYKYIERKIKGYDIAKLVCDDVSFDVVIDDFNPSCALIIRDGKEVILYRNTEKILPKNSDEILKYIYDQIDHIEQNGIIYNILLDTLLCTDEFMEAVRALHVSSM